MATQAKSPDGRQPSLTIEGVFPGTPHVLRQVNQIQALGAIRRLGPISRPAIADATGLSKVTVNEVVADLLELELVTEELASAESGSARPGPRPRVLSFRHDDRHVIGIDIGAVKSLVFVSDLNGNLLAQNRISTKSPVTRSKLLGQIKAGAATALQTAGITTNSVVAVGVGTPGVVDPTDGTIALAPQLPGWEGFNLAEELDIFSDCPVIVANEVHLAVLGEEWRGAARGIQNAAYLHIGVGVGLGVIVGGELVRGATGAAGEIGYMPLGLDDDPDRPEETGRFEWLVGGPAYARHATRLIENGGGKGMLAEANGGAVDAEVVYRAAARGDEEANAIVDELLDLTAVGVAAMASIFDPNTVIVGGGVSKAGDQLLGPLREKVTSLLPVVPHFATSTLGDEAVAFGALRVAIERWEADVFTLKS